MGLRWWKQEAVPSSSSNGFACSLGRLAGTTVVLIDPTELGVFFPTAVGDGPVSTPPPSLVFLPGRACA